MRTLPAPATMILIALAALATALLAGPAQACGPSTPCVVSNGEYRIRMPRVPEDWDGKGKVGAILFMHGWRGTAEGEMKNGSLERIVSGLGLALIAPQGEGRTWSFPASPSRNRDEIAFIDTVLDDALARFPIDPERVMASGFSLGGSMAWYLACFLGERFAGFAPVAGAFWAPQPEKCPGPEPNLFHVHGTADRTVPLAGRPIGDRARQGDVGQGLSLWFEKGGCAAEQPETLREESSPPAASAKALVCQRRLACGGRVIELCLHDGGHRFEARWLQRAWRELAALKGWTTPDQP